MFNKNSVGDILKQAREIRKFSQEKVAQQYGTSRQTISDYELSKSSPSIERFLILLEILQTSVLIEKNGNIKIMEEEKMDNFEKENVNNFEKESRNLRLELLKFDLEEKLKEYYEQNEKTKNECIKKYSEVVDLARSKGLEVYHGYGFTDDMWHMDFSKEGVAFSISKDNKEIQVEVEKSSYLEIFDLEDFIEEIEFKHGENIANEIFKIIVFDAYTYNMGREIFDLFKYISKGSEVDSSKISRVIPMIKDFEDIISEQLKSKNYIEKIYELTIDSNDVPLPYLLNICDEYQPNNIWIKLVLDDYDEIYEPESFDCGVIVDACEYAVNIFDKFDELFDEWKAYM